MQQCDVSKIVETLEVIVKALEKPNSVGIRIERGRNIVLIDNAILGFDVGIDTKDVQNLMAAGNRLYGPNRQEVVALINRLIGLLETYCMLPEEGKKTLREKIKEIIKKIGDFAPEIAEIVLKVLVKFCIS